MSVNITFDMSDDTKTRELVRWREKSLLDMMSSLDTAKNEGINIGRQESVKIGRDEERAAIISKLRLSGMTEEEISRILNL